MLVAIIDNIRPKKLNPHFQIKVIEVKSIILTTLICLFPVKKNLPLKFQTLLKSRPGIEPIIAHLNNDHRLGRNYLLER